MASKLSFAALLAAFLACVRSAAGFHFTTESRALRELLRTRGLQPGFGGYQDSIHPCIDPRVLPPKFIYDGEEYRFDLVINESFSCHFPAGDCQQDPEYHHLLQTFHLGDAGRAASSYHRKCVTVDTKIEAFRFSMDIDLHCAGVKTANDSLVTCRDIEQYYHQTFNLLSHCDNDNNLIVGFCSYACMQDIPTYHCVVEFDRTGSYNFAEEPIIGCGWCQNCSKDGGTEYNFLACAGLPPDAYAKIMDRKAAAAAAGDNSSNITPPPIQQELPNPRAPVSAEEPGPIVQSSGREVDPGPGSGGGSEPEPTTTVTKRDKRAVQRLSLLLLAVTALFLISFGAAIYQSVLLRRAKRQMTQGTFQNDGPFGGVQVFGRASNEDLSAPPAKPSSSGTAAAASGAPSKTVEMC
uniref:Uncharacterized protein n=1 Tax=Vitrella brassicaformis TaxID=1169539 RepID=A0A7S1P3T3_9ALVE|mmetsp:Transcript_38183/g.109007  ORF Transcript_38183/g.109007 Transcript_38183/m.109007 type:complete len:408 (+) Transcript_38183:40-1263(+)